MADNESALKQVFADVFGVDPASIDDATSVDTVERWTSARHLGFVMALEERFNVTLIGKEALEIISYPLVKLVLRDHGIEFPITRRVPTGSDRE